MKKAVTGRIIISLFLSLGILWFSTPCQEPAASQKIVFDGYIEELLKMGKVGYALVENGAVVKVGTLTDNSLLLPKTEKGKTRVLFFMTDDLPPFVVRLKGGEKSIRIEKIELREVKLDLLMYPLDAEISWFLKSWDDIPFELFPVIANWRINGKVMKLPAKEEVFIEIRAKGILPSFGVLKAGHLSYKPEPPQTGWCREVRIRDKNGKLKKECYCAFVKVRPWPEPLPVGEAVLSDEFGRAILTQKELDESGMLVVLGPSYKPYHIYSVNPTDKPLGIVLEKGDKLSGKIFTETGKPLKATVSFNIAFNSPLMKEGIAELQAKGDGSIELGLPDNRDGISLGVSAEGYELQTFEANVIKSPLVVRLKQERPMIGKIEDKEGYPISGAIIHMGDKEFETDIQGNFALKGVKGADSGWVDALGFFGKDFKIEPNEPFLRIRLEKGNGGIKAKIVDTEGNPVEEILGTAHYQCGEMKGACGYPRKKYKNGNFQLSINLLFDNKAADYKVDLLLFAKGFVPMNLKDIQVPQGEIVDLGTIVFERGFLVTGKVKLDDNKPAAGAKVTLVQIKDDDEKKIKNLTGFEKDQSGWTAKAGSFGEFQIGGLVAGSFAVFIDYPKYPEYESKADISGSASMGEFTLTKGTDLTIKVFSNSGIPKENFLVKAFPEEVLFAMEYKPSLTSSDGSVVFEGQKESGYKIEVSNPKNELVIKDTFTLSQKNTVKEIYLPGDKLELTVTFNGAPLSNQNFYIAEKPENYDYGYYIPDEYGTSILSSGNKLYKVSTDSKGIISMEDLNQGRYVLFSGDSQFQAVRSFSYGEDNFVKVEVKGFTASGKLTDKSSGDLGNKIVPLFCQNSVGPPVIYTRTDASGNFSFSNLEAGKYAIWFINVKVIEHAETSFEVVNSDVTLEPIEIEE